MYLKEGRMTRTTRQPEQQMSDALVAARFIAKQIERGIDPVSNQVAKELKRDRRALERDLQYFVDNSDDAALVSTISNWRNARNHRLSDEQRIEVIALYREMRSNPALWGFQNQSDAAIAIGIPERTLKDWWARWGDSDVPFNFTAKVDSPERFHVAGLLGEVALITATDMASDSINSMRAEIVNNRMEEIRTVS